MQVNLNERELATVLAALRYWQRVGYVQSAMHGGRALPEWSIAIDGGTLTELSHAEIDFLCERINLGEGEERSRQRIAIEARVIQATRTPPSDEESKQAAFTAADKAMTELGPDWQSVVWFDRSGDWTWRVERGPVKVWLNLVGGFNAFHSSGYFAPNCATAKGAVERLDATMAHNTAAMTQ